jgi:LPS O-antigen subunit length determinant protein (WzzB/FepE family)
MAATRVPGSDGELDLRELFGILRDGWKLIAIAATAGVLVSLLIALTSPRIYRARALVAPAAEQQLNNSLAAVAGQFGGLAALAGLNIGGASAAREQAVALLQSRLIGEALIREQGLKPLLFPSRWDDEQKAWDKREPSDGETYRRFDQKIRSVEEDRRTGLITLTIEFTDRERVAEWASDLVRRVNRMMRERAIAEAEGSLNYLNQELEKSSVVEVRQSIYNLIEGQVKTIMLAHVREEYALKIVDPPVVPDVRDYVKPRRALIVALGLFLGTLAGVVVVFVRRVWLAGEAAEA